VNAHHQCRESQAEWVREKDVANFCGFFEGSNRQKNDNTDKNKVAKALNDLFSRDPETTLPGSQEGEDVEGRQKLDALFKK